MKKTIFSVLVILLLAAFLLRQEKRETSESDSRAGRGDLLKSATVEVDSSSDEKGSVGADDLIALELAELNQPLRFWGRVVDQDENAVAGAVVAASSQVAYEAVSNVLQMQTAQVQSHTNATGIFEVAGLTGSRVTIDSISKAGYTPLFRSGQVFVIRGSNADFHPDLRFPVVFRMWKQDELPRLIAHEKVYWIPHDGTPASFDLVRDDSAPPGRLQISLLRNPQTRAPGDQRYDWEAVFEIIGGGALLTSEAFPALAPEGDYQKELRIGFSKDDPEWSENLEVSFYVHFANGWYGRVTAELATGSTGLKSSLWLHSFVNPTGSRVVVVDPNGANLSRR